jgi:hypothetical protein
MQIEIANLVEKDRALSSRRYQSHSRPVGSSEGALLMTKELTVD